MYLTYAAASLSYHVASNLRETSKSDVAYINMLTQTHSLKPMTPSSWAYGHAR